MNDWLWSRQRWSFCVVCGQQIVFVGIFGKKKKKEIKRLIVPALVKLKWVQGGRQPELSEWGNGLS